MSDCSYKQGKLCVQCLGQWDPVGIQWGTLLSLFPHANERRECSVRQRNCSFNNPLNERGWVGGISQTCTRAILAQVCGAQIFFWMSLVLSGGDSLVTSPGPFGSKAEGIWELVGILLGVLAIGIVIGWFAHTWLGSSRTKVPQTQRTNVWVRLTTKALRFIHRRRVLALAFNLGNYSLRNSEGSKPNQARRRRVSSLDQNQVRVHHTTLVHVRGFLHCTRVRS